MYSEVENKLIYNNNNDMFKIRYWIENDVNVNAQETTEMEDGHILSSVFQDFMMSNDPKKIDFLEVLKIFIDNGLDLVKFGPSIISDFHLLIRDDIDFIGMTKLILDSARKKIDVDVAVEGIETEISWIENSEDSRNYYEEPQKILEKLYGILEILKEYKK